MLEKGIKAPDFSLQDQNGILRSLRDYSGKKLLLYFYPKDNTSGCSKQAEGYSKLKAEFEVKGVAIAGVSRDSVASHKRFEEAKALTIALLSDPDRRVTEMFDIWKEKKLYGKTTMGVVRTTYLIDEDGFIIYANDKVKAAEDAEMMLELL